MSLAASDELNELAAALCAAQAEFTKIPKDSENPFFKSKYADLPTVVEKSSPVLTSHGLAVSQFLGYDETGDTLTTWLLHTSGQYICESMRLHLPKQDPQGQGSATTYARRYSYMSVLGLVADVDDDGHQASAQSPYAAPAKAAAASASAEVKLASEKQRGLIFGKAQEAKLGASTLANILLLTAGAEVKLFETEDEAQKYVDHNLNRLPARLVNPVLEKIAESAPNPVAPDPGGAS